jgi:glutathione synthase
LAIWDKIRSHQERKMIKLGIVMDPISSINIKKDSSFAMLLETQRRGWELHYMEMSDLYMRGGDGRARTRLLSVKQDKDSWFSFGAEQDLPLHDLDVILMRKDPPFDTEFIYATYILERAEDKGTLIVNKPQSLRDCNEKLFTAWFPELTPDTLVSRSKDHIRKFHQEHGDIILKPLDGMGGTSIFRVKQDDPNLSVIIETLTELGNRFCMVQNFLPAIKEGDKRVLVVDGEPVPYCLARIPAQGETRGNLAAGGHGEARSLSESDWKIARAVAPVLKQKGLIFVGLDIIGDRLTEINVTSPTCIREIEAAFPDISITSMLMDAIEVRLANKKT